MMKRIFMLLLAAVLLAGCSAEGSGSTEPIVLPAVSQSMEDIFPGLGGVMPEMTVTTTEGVELTLSELLEEKKLVVLNFWFSDCTWCRREFPAMELAYHRYQEDVEIIALNPVDPAAAVEVFRKEHALSMPMAVCPGSWVVEMGVRGYPTSVFIDRDGVICLIHAGAITDTDTFYKIFEIFTADDYQQKIYFSIDELVK